MLQCVVDVSTCCDIVTSSFAHMSLQVAAPSLQQLVAAFRESVDVKRVQRDGGVVVHLAGLVTEDPVDQHSASSSASHQLIAPHHGRCKRKLQASCVCNPNFAVIKSLLRVSPVMTPRDRQMAQALQVLDDENQSRLSGSFSGTKLRMQHAIY